MHYKSTRTKVVPIVLIFVLLISKSLTGACSPQTSSNNHLTGIGKCALKYRKEGDTPSGHNNWHSTLEIVAKGDYV